jgi:predicted RNase H-like HicB family nuclease
VGAYVEELPGANTQGATLEEARENLKEAVAPVLEANRELAERELAGQNVVRESLLVTTDTLIILSVAGMMLAALIGGMVNQRATKRLIARRRHGQCLGCGYDLRHGTGVCPECGRPHAVGMKPDENADRPKRIPKRRRNQGR